MYCIFIDNTEQLYHEGTTVQKFNLRKYLLALTTVIKLFCWFFNFVLNLIKLEGFEEMDRKCLKYAETWWAFYWLGLLVCYWLAAFFHWFFFIILTQTMKTFRDIVVNASSRCPLRAFFKVSQRLFKNCIQQALKYSSGISPIPCKPYSKGLLKRISQSDFNWAFPVILLEAACTCLSWIKMEDATETCINHQRVFS